MLYEIRPPCYYLLFTIDSATAHTGGTRPDEKNHITAQFHDAKGQALTQQLDRQKDGETMVGEKNQHHVYVNDKLTAPSAWTNAVDASNRRKAEAEAAEKEKADKAFAEKAAEAKKVGESTRASITPKEKKKQRDEIKKKKKADAKKKTTAS